jgi:alpha-amylase
MASICMYFHVHQPNRLRRFTVFDGDSDYFDGFQNADICRKVSRSCYLPANRLLLGLIERHGGRFKVAFSITGVLLEQLRDYAPEVLASFQTLGETGCVEFLAQTYHNSFSFLFSMTEFAEQVQAHRQLIEELFGRKPRVFRSTERVYDNTLAETVERIGGFDAILIDSPDSIPGRRNRNFIYKPPNHGRLKLLLKNGGLSDDIAFRFSNRLWSEWPLRPDKFAGWINALHGNAAVVNLCIDYETFGEHYHEETGIFDFIQRLPGEILQHPRGDFKMPSEATAYYEALDVLDIPDMAHEKIAEPNLANWLGNTIQRNAVTELYRLEPVIRATGDLDLLASWRKLQTRDHLSYMDTRHLDSAEARQYASPYESPYDSYINFMNVLEHLKTRCAALGPTQVNTQPISA